MPPASSPCTRICTIDDKTGLCLGCGRTLAEIASWGSMDEEKRSDIIAVLPARMERTGHRRVNERSDEA